MEGTKPGGEAMLSRDTPMAQTPFDVASELRQMPGLAAAGSGDVEALARAATHRVVHANTALVEQGSVAGSLFFLARGAAKTVHRPSAVKEPDAIVLSVMRGPCVVPDLSIVDGQPATATVVTLRSSQVIAVERDPLFELFARSPAFARYLLERASATARSHVRRMEELVSGAVDERVVKLLEGLAREHGTPLGKGRFIAIPLRRRDIAFMVNATTETVSRVLAKLERAGRARSSRDGIWWQSQDG